MRLKLHKEKLCTNSLLKRKKVGRMEYTVEVVQTKTGKNTIRHPILTPEERERRMQSLRTATERYAKAMLDAQKETATA